MKILYNVQSGVLTCTNAEYRAPGVGEALAEGDFMVMDKGPEFYRYNGGFVVLRNEEEVKAELASSAFSFELLVGALFQQLAIPRIKALGVHTANLEWLVAWKNWTGVVAFLNMLLTDGDISQAEFDLIKACFSYQNLDLDYFVPQA